MIACGDDVEGLGWDAMSINDSYHVCDATLLIHMLSASLFAGWYYLLISQLNRTALLLDSFHCSFKCRKEILLSVERQGKKKKKEEIILFGIGAKLGA